MARAANRFKLQPADPFDLIRWLARSQSDARKAVAELVQNSIDARAKTVRIERRRVRGAPALLIRDDGEGVLPALGREEALRHLGTHVGHSHKLGLSPAERHSRVIAGQYGVGLLGFWAIGSKLELRSRVAGSDVHVLTLVEDRQTAELGTVPHELDASDTFTELAVFELHDAALRQLSGRRLADYLAAELRGPILASGATVEVHDHLVRGIGQKRFEVTPRRFEGIPIAVPSEIAVDGHPSIRVELYLARGAERPAIQLACAGTLVADDLAELDVLGFDHAPWRGCDVVGLIDFPGFQVPPGTRRGVVPNAAAIAFTRALATIEPVIVAGLAIHEQRRRSESDRSLVDDLRKALRGLHERMPHYDLPSVDDTRAGVSVEAAGVSGRALEEVATTPKGEAADEGSQSDLFPPGPLATVAIVPVSIEIAAGGERRICARPVDADGRVVRTGVSFGWAIAGEGFSLVGDGPRPALSAAGDLLPGAEAVISLVVSQGEHTASALAIVRCTDPKRRERGKEGIPRPVLIDAPGASWRSRMEGDIWQVNTGHEDYLAFDDGRARLRYVVALLGKEIVLRTYGQPGAGELLEHLVAVIAHAERNLRA
ncbi:MAG: ATP-binding protein [Kofleriaceae bacterium]